MEIEVYAPDPQGNYPGGGGCAGEVRVVRDRDLQVGDELTWFYPSTEWLGSRPFDCKCGAGSGLCIGVHSGARFLEGSVLERYRISKHVQELVGERDKQEKKM